MNGSIVPLYKVGFIQQIQLATGSGNYRFLYKITPMNIYHGNYELFPDSSLIHHRNYSIHSKKSSSSCLMDKSLKTLKEADKVSENILAQ